jgi:hypothetical protein
VSADVCARCVHNRNVHDSEGVCRVSIQTTEQVAGPRYSYVRSYMTCPCAGFKGQQ